MHPIRLAGLFSLVVAAALVGWYWPVDEGTAVSMPNTLEMGPSATAEQASTASESEAPVVRTVAVEGATGGFEDAADGSSLFGLVVDAGDRPIVAATVTLLPAGAPALPGTVVVASDAAGRFCLPNLPAGNYRVRAVAANCAAAVSEVVRVEAGSDAHAETLRLVAGATLRGIVVDGSGHAIAAAAIRVGGESATSLVDGRFEVPHLPVHRVAVEVSADGWLSWQQSGVDPSTELRVVLPAGLVVTGAVFDRMSAAPVELFAVRAHRWQPLRAVQQGTPDWQLRHRIDRLQLGLANVRDPVARANDERAIAEYAARLATLQSSAPAAPRVSTDLGEPALHAEGRFTLDRLDEGLYVIEVLAPGHVFARTAPLLVQRDIAVPPLRIDVEPGVAQAGTVCAADGSPIAGASIELVRAASSAPSHAASRLQWLVGQRPLEGAIVATATSDRGGGFVLACQPAGTFQLVARHALFCTTTSAQFAMPSDGAGQIVMSPRGSIVGQVRSVPVGWTHRVTVSLVGGASNLRQCRVDEQGRYQCDGLEPGEYVLRAGVGDPDALAADLLRQLFDASAEAPRRDITLAAGEHRTLDLVLSLSPMGVVQGTVQHNGASAPGCRISLGSPRVSRPMVAVTDANGNFVVNDVPVGDWELRVLVRGARTQELHRETVTVLPGAVTAVRPMLSSGGLMGRVVAADGTAAAELSGDLFLLPGADLMPTDLNEYRRTHRVHQLRVRDGLFRGDALTSGSSLAILRLRRRESTTAVVHIVVGSSSDVELAAGPLRP